MAKEIESLEVGQVYVDGYWDRDDEVCIDLGTGSEYLNPVEVERLRDHLTALLELKKETA